LGTDLASPRFACRPVGTDACSVPLGEGEASRRLLRLRPKVAPSGSWQVLGGPTIWY